MSVLGSSVRLFGHSATAAIQAISGQATYPICDPDQNDPKSKTVNTDTSDATHVVSDPDSGGFDVNAWNDQRQDRWARRLKSNSDAGLRIYTPNA